MRTAGADRLEPEKIVPVSTGAGWLIARLASAARVTLGRLADAGYHLGYADPRTAADPGYLTAAQISDQPHMRANASYLSFGTAARDDGVPGQSSSAQRSNFRVAHRRFPGVWTNTVHSIVTVLGAFAAHLPPAAIYQLLALNGDPLLDADDHSALEDDDVGVSWEHGVAATVRALLDDDTRRLFDTLDNSVGEDLWWATADDLGVEPVHDGYGVSFNYRRLLPSFVARLHANRRREQP
ncbi:hypothetical protein ACFY36_51065 [Actinoplanes sp. NPDC000266]